MSHLSTCLQAVNSKVDMIRPVYKISQAEKTSCIPPVDFFTDCEVED